MEPDLIESAKTAAHVAIAGVSKRFGAAKVLDGVDLDVGEGALVTLLGPSGCGKTTLLRLIAGLASPDAGHIAIAGRDMTHTPPHKRNVGVVFQNYALFPHLNVAGNVGFGLRGRRYSHETIKAKILRALELVKLSALADRPIAGLSGGQQQRVALARALAVEPSVILFDEALSALDRALRETMQIELRRLLKGLGATAVFVTHDQGEALTMSDRIAVMSHGRIEQHDDPQTLYARPATLFAMRFVGVSSELSGIVRSSDGEWLAVETRHGLILRARGKLGPGSRTIIATRPEHAKLNAADACGAMNRVEGRIRQITFQGARTRVAVDIGEAADFVVELSGSAAPPAAEHPVTIHWPADETFAYPAGDAA